MIDTDQIEDAQPTILETWEIRVPGHFDSAHLLKSYLGQCANLHGHRWNVIAAFTYTKLDEGNLSVDFKILKNELDAILSSLDHTFLNKVLEEDNPTAECLARLLFEEFQRRSYEPVSITIEETPGCSVTYTKEIVYDV